MKKIISFILLLTLAVSAMSVICSADETNPTITAINILDEDAQLIEICFSEPVNCANLGYIIPVEEFPNGDHAWANLEWNGHYEYYGCVDADGNEIGEGEESYICVDGDQTNIYATRMVVTVGMVQNFGLFVDLSGIEFKDFNGMPGAFSTPDGRKMEATDSSGSLFVPFSSFEPVETEPKETEPKETEAKETEAKETEVKETEAKETEAKETEPKETEAKETEAKETASKETTGETVNKDKKDEKKTPVLPIVIGSVAAAAVIALAVILIVKKKK